MSLLGFWGDERSKGNEMCGGTNGTAPAAAAAAMEIIELKRSDDGGSRVSYDPKLFTLTP